MKKFAIEFVCIMIGLLAIIASFHIMLVSAEEVSDEQIETELVERIILQCAKEGEIREEMQKLYDMESGRQLILSMSMMEDLVPRIKDLMAAGIAREDLYSMVRTSLALEGKCDDP